MATGTREHTPARAPRRGAPLVPVRSCGFKSGRSRAMCSAPNKSNNKGGHWTPPPPPGAGAVGGPGGGPRPRPSPAPPGPHVPAPMAWAAAPVPLRRPRPLPPAALCSPTPGPGLPPPPARRRPSPPSLPPASRRAGPLPAAAVSGASLFSAARSGRGGQKCAAVPVPLRTSGTHRTESQRPGAPGARAAGAGGNEGGGRGTGVGGRRGARASHVTRRVTVRSHLGARGRHAGQRPPPGTTEAGPEWGAPGTHRPSPAAWARYRPPCPAGTGLKAGGTVPAAVPPHHSRAPAHRTGSSVGPVGRGDGSPVGPGVGVLLCWWAEKPGGGEARARVLATFRARTGSTEELLSCSAHRALCPDRQLSQGVCSQFKLLCTSKVPFPSESPRILSC